MIETVASREVSATSATAEKPDVSIIIPALNEARVVGRCLDALTRLDGSGDRFEVILVDNGSTDATLEIASTFHDRLHLRVLQSKGVHISALRNLGAREARGAVLAFLDADCLAPTCWLARIQDLIQQPDLGVAGAHYSLPSDSSWVGRMWHLYQEAPKSGAVSHVPAGDLVMRREDFQRIGGFDESIQTNEDFELCERARAAGMCVRALPAISVIHLGTAQTLSAFYRKQRWHGSHVARVFLRDVVHSGNRNAVLFALYMLIALSAASGGALWAIFGGPPSVPVIAVIALLLPPLMLAASRAGGNRQWNHFVPLALLYLTYGIARAQALLSLRTRR